MITNHQFCSHVYFPIFCIFQLVKVISFNRLCNVLQISGEAQQQLLRAVQHVALLIQGNWVVKSEILYPTSEQDKSKTSGGNMGRDKSKVGGFISEKEKAKLVGVTGICPKILSKARDYVVSILLHLRSFSPKIFVF